MRLRLFSKSLKRRYIRKCINKQVKLRHDAAVNAELLRIREMPLRQNKKGMIFSKSGFSIEDTDAHFEKLENEIMKKIFL